MATGKLDIINLALMRIGESPIQSLEEGSTPANSAKALYDMSRRAVLRDFDWSFAMKTSSLPLLANEDEEAGVYVCSVPADCLRVVQVLRRYEANFARGTAGFYTSNEWFRVQGNKLYVRTPVPYVRYVRDEENTNLFDAKFVEALSYKLAGELAMPVRQSESLMASMLNAYQGLVGTAAEESQNEHEPALSQNPYVEVRYGN
jgi:hypothetical protein